MKSFYEEEVSNCNDLKKHKDKILNVLRESDSPLRAAIIEYLVLHRKEQKNLREKLRKLNLQKFILRNIS